MSKALTDLTPAELRLVDDDLRRRAFPKANVDPIEDAVVISRKVQGNGCLSFFIGILPIFGATVKPAPKPLCVCLEYIHDNGDCPVHGKSPYKGK